MSDVMHVEQRVLQRGEVSMRLIINRSHRHMRFMDFRVGCYENKRDALDCIAREEGLNKVFTLVEKQDSQSWRAIGFTKEGIYPSFFRTTDAYVMSRHYDEAGQPMVHPEPNRGSLPEPKALPGPRRSGRMPRPRLRCLEDSRSREQFWSTFNGHLRSIPFGRVDSPDLLVLAQVRDQEGWACAEIDDSFGHAIIGFAPPPGDPKNLKLLSQAAAHLLERLGRREISNLFGLSFLMDPWSHELYTELGFSITGRLPRHLSSPEGASTACIWHLRLGV